MDEALQERVARKLGGRTVALVGMMGAGKSAIGRRLAQALALPFVDADTEIETAANASIAEIFEEHGEAYFRDGERRVIQRLLDAEPKILATGGGAFAQPDTRAAIETGSITVWLQADRDLILSRVKRRNTRPLLKGDDPAAVIDRLIAERSAAYGRADIHVQSRDVAHEVITGEILAALDHFLTEPAKDRASP